MYNYGIAFGDVLRAAASEREGARNCLRSGHMNFSFFILHYSLILLRKIFY